MGVASYLTNVKKPETIREKVLVCAATYATYLAINCFTFYGTLSAARSREMDIARNYSISDSIEFKEMVSDRLISREDLELLYNPLYMPIKIQSYFDLVLTHKSYFDNIRRIREIERQKQMEKIRESRRETA